MKPEAPLESAPPATQPDPVSAGAKSLTLEPQDAARLGNLCGPLNAHLRQIEQRLGVVINHRGASFEINGAQAPSAGLLLQQLYAKTARGQFTPEELNLDLQAAAVQSLVDESAPDPGLNIRTRRGTIRGRGANQKAYLERIATDDISFGIGPAGTGKTFLAVASAVNALQQQQVTRLVLVRPAVEAGERLGFLPGDMAQKVDPYLRPLFDALYEMLGFERVEKLIERNVIEVAPLAFMRGRSLNDAFIILDEAQNTSVEQMKMFLTRIGFGSKAVVTGDVTQIDLPNHQVSGLKQVTQILEGVDGISFTFFKSKDVVRHALVQKIVDAYDHWSEHDEADT